MPIEARKCILEALPESRWYRQSNTIRGTITIEYPTHLEEAHAQQRNQVKIPTETFWKLISWHYLSNKKEILSIQEYDVRAKHMWEAITMSQEQSGHKSLCWAADRTLLDIFIDVCGCTQELFSNILNTYHRFESRRSLHVHPAFKDNANMETNGLDPTTYTGVTYGNPPFDGKKKTTKP